MKKTTALFVLSVCLGIANQTHANEGQKIACEGTGGVWRPFAGTPQCDCSARPDLFSLLAPGNVAALIAIRNRANVMKDVCESRELAKTSANINKDKDKDKGKDKGKKDEKPAAPPTPANIVAQLIPDSLTHDSASPASITLLVTSGAKEIAQVIMTCDEGCKVNGKTVDIGPPLFTKAKPSQVITLTSSGKDSGTVSVQFNTKNGKTVPVQPLEATVQWTTKAPPAPVVPVLSACVKSNGIDGPNGTCVCLGDLELVPGQNICRPKPVPAPAPKAVEETGTYFHPYVGGMYGYGSSKSLKGSNGYFNVGLGIDIRPWLLGKIGVGTGGPGATRTYTDGTPVILANGNTDKRPSSFVADASLMFHLDWWGFDLGYIRQARGTPNWFNPTSPADVTSSVFFGPKAIWQLDQFAFVIGPDLLIGAHTMGSMAANTEVGIIVSVDVMAFNPLRLVGTRIR